VTPAEADPALRRFELDAVVACGVVAGLALAVTAVRSGLGPGVNAFLGVLAGGLLTALSYRAIKGGVDIVVSAARNHRSEQDSTPDQRSEQTSTDSSAQDRRLEQASTDTSARDQRSQQDFSPAPVLSTARRAFLAVKFFTRYALLAVAAYVMLTCFRLHPVAVLVGATSPFLAALVLVGRLSRARARRPPR